MRIFEIWGLNQVNMPLQQVAPLSLGTPYKSRGHQDCSGPYKTEAIARVINDYMGRGSRLHRDLFSSHEIPATYEEFKGRVEASLRSQGIDPQHPHLRAS